MRDLHDGVAVRESDADWTRRMAELLLPERDLALPVNLEVFQIADKESAILVHGDTSWDKSNSRLRNETEWRCTGLLFEWK